MYVVMPVDQGNKDKMVSVRLTESEMERLDCLVNRVLARERFATKADVFRELLGVVDSSIILPKDMALLRGSRSVVSPETAQDVLTEDGTQDMVSRLRELYDSSTYKDRIDEMLKDVIYAVELLPKKKADEVKPIRRSKGQDKG